MATNSGGIIFKTHLILYIFIFDGSKPTRSISISGHQEFSSRTAGLSLMFVMGIVVPVLMVLVCIAYRVAQLRNKELKKLAS